MVILVRDHVPRCYTADDGAILYNLLADAFSRDEQVTLSFSGVTGVPSSFVNAALVPLFRERDPAWVKSHLSIVGATQQVATMIRRCVDNAVRPLEAA